MLALVGVARRCLIAVSVISEDHIARRKPCAASRSASIDPFAIVEQTAEILNDGMNQPAGPPHRQLLESDGQHLTCEFADQATAFAIGMKSFGRSTLVGRALPACTRASSPTTWVDAGRIWGWYSRWPTHRARSFTQALAARRDGAIVAMLFIEQHVTAVTCLRRVHGSICPCHEGVAVLPVDTVAMPMAAPTCTSVDQVKSVGGDAGVQLLASEHRVRCRNGRSRAGRRTRRHRNTGHGIAICVPPVSIVRRFASTRSPDAWP